MNDVLQKIAAYKKEEVARSRRKRPIAKLQAITGTLPKTRDFLGTLRRASSDGYGIIAEIKRASPSKGLIRSDFCPRQLAMDLCRGGAACLSVLTDAPSFQGSLQHLSDAASAVELPVLRKDFMLDPYQVYEARVAGADCVLLILSMLSDAQAAEIEDAALGLGLDVLIETHDRDEVQRALQLKSRLIGINNRDLKTFEVLTETTLQLACLLDGNEITIVSESGLHFRSDLEMLARAGVRCFLIGESLMRSRDPGSALQELASSPFQPERST